MCLYFPVQQEMWSKLEAQCNRRSRCIEKFREALEAVEVLRSGAVGEELRRLVDDMVSIACKMPHEIERIAEVGRAWGAGRRGNAEGAGGGGEGSGQYT